jgi:hypothetical protein
VLAASRPFPGSIYFRSLPATLTGDVVGLIEKVGPEADPTRCI